MIVFIILASSPDYIGGPARMFLGPSCGYRRVWFHMKLPVCSILLFSVDVI